MQKEDSQYDIGNLRQTANSHNLLGIGMPGCRGELISMICLPSLSVTQSLSHSAIYCLTSPHSPHL